MFDWDIRSVILTIAAVQSIFISTLLLIRNQKTARLSDKLLAFFLLAISATMSEHIAGWLGLYESQLLTFFPFGETFLFAPLAYLYIKSITNSDYAWSKKEWIHFLPASVYLTVHFIVWLYPLQQKQAMINLLFTYKWGEIQGYANAFVFSLYLYKIIRHYRAYLKWLPNEYSNTEKLQLNWLRNFIILFSIYYIIFLGFAIGGLISWYDYTIAFWQYFMLSIIIYYTSVSGYAFVQKFNVAFDMYKSVSESKSLQSTVLPASVTEVAEPSITGPNNPTLYLAEPKTKSPLTANENSTLLLGSTNIELEPLKALIINHINHNKPYLDPELSLSQLANQLGKPPYIVTLAIKNAFGKNFNDLINGYRVDAVIEKLKNGEQKSQTLLGIAYDCGFNSKATFNRAFKKVQNTSPKEFIETL